MSGVFSIRGYGIRCEDFKDTIVPEKVFALLKEKIGNDSKAAMVSISVIEAKYNETRVFDISEIVDGFCTTYGHLAELFAMADETGCLSVDDNPDAGNSYLFCEAAMPWEVSELPFQTVSEANEAIIAAVQKLTELSAEGILDHIDDVYDGGFC